MRSVKTKAGFAIVALLAVAAPLVTSQGAPAAGGAAASKTATVKIVNFAFRPATLNIAKGTKVVFSNASTKTHTATRNGTFDTGRLGPGKSASVTFTQRGTFRYFCEIHSEMSAKMVID